ncbi:Tubulin-folding cofactor D [Abortiporus biennis]
MEETPPESKQFSGFEKHQEFLNLQNTFLASQRTSDYNDERTKVEDHTLLRLKQIFHEYQEQSFLVDPYLESLLVPVVEQLKGITRRPKPLDGTTPEGLSTIRLAVLLYDYIKFRGYKTITRFFPHEIADLSIVLEYLTFSGGLPQTQRAWPLRYVLLLWLSLICMLPFDLEQFDEPGHQGQTASRIETLAQSHLDKAGIERDGAAVFLARLYTRKDMLSHFSLYLQKIIPTVQEHKDQFATMGSVQVVCEVVKSGPADQIKANIQQLMELVTVLDGEILKNNTLLRKLRVKLMSRIILRLLPINVNRSRRRGRALAENEQNENASEAIEEDMDIPEETETVLDELFKALQDKDTVVRYSSAKGVARIAERLPAEFSEQVFENILHLFTIHSAAVARIYEMPSIAEGTWHGASLACAEISRRGLIPDSKLTELLGWMTKALYFDIRQGAHSIGSNVRDAACYVLWSLARAQSIEALSSHANELAGHLVTISLFDREVHIRRAASAAFQEFVGRTSLFPHGIDVLRKTDFYAVGTRRNAFLVAAKEVSEHDVYRPGLINHLIDVTLRHWDSAMRQLGAQSLGVILQLDPSSLIPSQAARISEYLAFPDLGDVHGALLALTELAQLCDCSNLQDERRKIFSYLSKVTIDIIKSPRHELITSSACLLIAQGLSLPEIQLGKDSAVPEWRDIIDSGLQNRNTIVQEAAASALQAVSRLVVCSEAVERLIKDGKTGPPAVQQSVCRALGLLDFAAHPHGLESVVEFLLYYVDHKTHGGPTNVEARRNAFNSMPEILINISSQISKQLTATLCRRMLDALLVGLEDYSTDQRGDIGSWIRMSCITALTTFAEILVKNAPNIPNFKDYLPPETYHNAVGGILKQGVERLDNVRQQAGEDFIRLLLLPLPEIENANDWKIEGDALMKHLFLSDAQSVGWNEGKSIFPKAVQLLDIGRYRPSVLAGLVLSIGSKTDSTHRPVSSSLVDYVSNLPVSVADGNGYDLRGLTKDLTYNILLDADALEDIYEDHEALQNLRHILTVATRNVSKLKSVQRINLSMKVVVNLLPVGALRSECINRLPDFLCHQYPRIRADTAEYLYIVLQSKDLGYETDEAEEILLETDWLSSPISTLGDAARQCTHTLSVVPLSN